MPLEHTQDKKLTTGNAQHMTHDGWLVGRTEV